MNFVVTIGEAFNHVMNLFGAPIIVPIIVLIISLVMRVNWKKALNGALYMAVGLVLFNAVLGILLGSITPYINQMAANVGISLPYVDVGWQGAAAIVYSNQLGYIYLVLGLGVNLLMFALKLTDTFQPTDIWNYYQFVFWAVIVQMISGSFWIGLAAAVFMNLVVLLTADIIAPSLQEFNGYENITNTSCPQGGAAPAIIFAWILRKLKYKGNKFTGESISGKLGAFGETITIGLIVGLIIAILGSIHNIALASTWGGIITTALTVAGVMIIYPNVSSLFVKGLVPLSNSMNERVSKGNKDGRRYFNVAMDPAIFFGHSSNLTAAMILIPIVFLISLFLPGNKLMLLADIPAMPFMTAVIIAIFKGDILMTVLFGAVHFSFCNIIISDVAAAFTEATKIAGVANQVPAIADAFSQNLGVATFTVGSNPVLYVVTKAFSAQGLWQVLGIVACIAIYLLVFLLFRKNRKRFWMAAGASEAFLREKNFID